MIAWKDVSCPWCRAPLWRMPVEGVTVTHVVRWFLCMGARCRASVGVITEPRPGAE